MNLATAKKMIANIHAVRRRSLRKDRTERTVDISAQDLIDIFNRQNGKCHWTGMELDQKHNYIKGHPMAISADRIDNNGNYTPDNIVLCLRMFNLGRSTATVDDFQKIMQTVECHFFEKWNTMVYG